jgi:hypothetical protein
VRGIIRILLIFVFTYFVLSAIKAVAQAFWPHAMERRKKLTRIDTPVDRRHASRNPPTDQN